MSRVMRENPDVRRFAAHVALGVIKGGDGAVRGLTAPVP